MLKIWTELKNFAVKLLDFPIEGQDGVTIKTLIGKDSPVNLESEVKMKDVSIEKERQLQISLSQGKTLALVVIPAKVFCSTCRPEQSIMSTGRTLL